MHNDSDNPYQSPTTEDELDSLYTAPNLRSQEKGPFNVLLLLIGTVGGCLAGNVIGTLSARLLGMIPGPLFQVTDLLEIKHPLGLVLLFFGGFVGAALCQKQ